MNFWKKKTRVVKFKKPRGQPFYNDIDPKVFVLMVLVFSCLFLVYAFVYLFDAQIPVLIDPIFIPDVFRGDHSPKYWMDGF